MLLENRVRGGLPVSVSKSNEKLVSQKYATLFLAWVPFKMIFLYVYCTHIILGLQKLDMIVENKTSINS